MPGEWPADLTPALPGYLAGQRWFSGSEAPPADSVRVASSRRLWSDGSDHEMWQTLVEVDGDCYQLILGVRPAGEPAQFLHGHETAVLGVMGNVYVYDATWDSDLARILLEVISDVGLSPRGDTAVAVAACELVLEGLAAHKRISRSEELGYTRLKPERRDPGYGKGGISFG